MGLVIFYCIVRGVIVMFEGWEFLNCVERIVVDFEMLVEDI